jgi:hypothetical protein
MAIITLNNNSLSSVTALPAGVGGKVLQVATQANTTYQVTTSSSYIDVTSKTFTPTSATSKVLVLVTFTSQIAGSSQSQAVYLKILRDGTSLYDDYAVRSYDQGSSGVEVASADGISILDSPSSTSELTYKLQYKLENGSEARHRYSSITLLEVGA